MYVKLSYSQSLNQSHHQVPDISSIVGIKVRATMNHVKSFRIFLVHPLKRLQIAYRITVPKNLTHQFEYHLPFSAIN